MTPFTKRGVPRSLAQDAWWLNAAPDANRGSTHNGIVAQTFGAGLAGLAFVILTDWILKTMPGGIMFAIWTIGFAVILALVFRVDRKTQWDMALITAAMILPVLSFVQALSVMWWALGALVLVARALNWPLARFVALWVRLPWAGVGTFLSHQRSKAGQSHQPGLRFLREWALAAVLGSGFVILFAVANPVIETLLRTVTDGVDGFDWTTGRILIWGLSAVFIIMVFSAAYIPIPAPRVQSKSLGAVMGLRNALVVFNLIFAVQLVSDVVVLGFGTGLPEGMTYASYAHRGSYPLIATALMAGLFMVLARRQAEQDRLLRVLLAVWVAQNMILLATAAYRLGVYVDVYGWTYLRLHCFVWLGLVAAGLGLVG
ncbi:MAG: DUF4173 domain-containing protein, partial [Pseudomonadota bacterium]